MYLPLHYVIYRVTYAVVLMSGLSYISSNFEVELSQLFYHKSNYLNCIPGKYLSPLFLSGCLRAVEQLTSVGLGLT